MTIRSTGSISYSLIVVFAFFSGCNPRTPEERAATAEKVISEVESVSLTKAIEDPNANQPDALAPSIVKLGSGDPSGNSKGATSSPPIETKKTIKPSVIVDDPSQPWPRPKDLPRETWEVQYLGNNNAVGYFHRKSVVSENGSGNINHEAKSQMRVSLKGVPYQQKVTIRTLERENGELISIEGTLELGSTTQKFQGRVKDDFLNFSVEENGEKFSDNIAWKPIYRGPFAVDQSMLRRPLKEREIRTLKYFDPFLRKVVDGRLEASDYIMIPTMLDGTKELLEVRNIGMVGENGSQSLLWVDENGEGFKSYIQANDITSFRTDPMTAQVFESMAELKESVAVSIPLKGPVDLLNGPSLASISYKFSLRSGEPFQLLAANDQQRQRISSEDPKTGRTSPTTVYVTVLQDGGEPDLLFEKKTSATIDQATLASSKFVPANSQLIVDIAKRLIAMDKTLSASSTNGERAEACRRSLQKAFVLKDFDKQISLVPSLFKTKQANCVEHALLFASVCRALKIPARIALGVKFNRSLEEPAMNFHVWVEIRDRTKWVPMDSSDPVFPTSLDRIKIKESNFNSENPFLDVLSVYRLLSELEIQVARK